MRRPIPRPEPQHQANTVQRPSNDTPAGLDRLSPTLASEIGGALERILARHKAETVAAAVDRKRATVYRWAGEPADVPVGALAVLAYFDPDPEFLPRVAGHLLAAVASSALAHRAAGRTVTILHEIAPIQADPEALRRAMGRPDFGDD